MLRGKYRSGILRRENERKIARYWQRFFFQVRDPRGGIPEQNRGKDDGVLTESTTQAASTNKEATDTKNEKSIKSRVDEKPVAINLAVLDQPNTSKATSKKKAKVKVDQSKAKSTQETSTQIMRQNLSAQTLREDDNSSMTEDFQRRPRYILVGWDNFRTKLMIALLILLILWAAIYFSLIGT